VRRILRLAQHASDLGQLQFTDIKAGTWESSDNSSKVTPTSHPREDYSLIMSRIVMRFVSKVSVTMAYRIAISFGDFRYHLSRKKREDISMSITAILGNRLSEEKIKMIVREAFRARQCERLDEILVGQNPRLLERLVEVRGEELLAAARRAGRGAILVTGHYGSVVACLAVLGAKRHPITLIARWSIREHKEKSLLTQTTNKLLRRRSISAFLAHPNIFVAADSFASAIQAASYLKRNEFVAVLVDAPVSQGEDKTATRVSFLGRDVLFKIGAITLSKVVGSPLLTVFIHRKQDYMHQVIEVNSLEEVGAREAEMLERCAHVVEEQILLRPSHWLCWKANELHDRGMIP